MFSAFRMGLAANRVIPIEYYSDLLNHVSKYGKILERRKNTDNLGFSMNYKAHIQNIDTLNSDTHTLRIQYEYTQKQFLVYGNSMSNVNE